MGQVVFHFETHRHGVVWHLPAKGAKQDKIGILFPDVMVIAYRHRLAFVETGIVTPLEGVHGLEEGMQGLWWEDTGDQVVYLMVDGVIHNPPRRAEKREVNRR